MEENNSPSGEPPTRRSLRDAEAARLAALSTSAEPVRGGEEPQAADDVDFVVAGFSADEATPRSGSGPDFGPESDAQESGDHSAERGAGSTAVAGASRGPKPARSVVRSVIGVAGELLITAGVLVFLFLGWQLWIQGIALNANQTNEASGLSQQWSAPTVGPTATGSSTGAASGAPTTGGTGATPLVMAAPSETTQFAVLYVPRFGADYKRTIAQGVDAKTVLNAGGAGHYEQSQMPGDMGNFAIAAHRDGWGSPFIKINELQVGDPIYVETQDGWYTYRFRDLEYVSPDGVDVLSAVPQAPDAAPTDRLITLTSCNPLYIASERIIAYGVLDSFTPRSAGAPTDIAGLSGKGA